LLQRQPRALHTSLIPTMTLVNSHHYDLAVNTTPSYRHRLLCCQMCNSTPDPSCLLALLPNVQQYSWSFLSSPSWPWHYPSREKLLILKQQWMEIAIRDHELPPTPSELVSDHTTTPKFVTVKKPLPTPYMKPKMDGWAGQPWKDHLEPKWYHLPPALKEGYAASTGTHGPKDECDMHQVTAEGMPQHWLELESWMGIKVNWKLSCWLDLGATKDSI
jgi:hypothetical protein